MSFRKETSRDEHAGHEQSPERGHEFASCIEACVRCAQACEHCESACLGESDVAHMTGCIHLDDDCAAICWAAAGFMSRGSASPTTSAACVPKSARPAATNAGSTSTTTARPAPRLASTVPRNVAGWRASPPSAQTDLQKTTGRGAMAGDEWLVSCSALEFVGCDKSANGGRRHTICILLQSARWKGPGVPAAALRPCHSLRGQTMEMRQFGRTDMRVSVLGFGGAEIGFEGATPDDVTAILTPALETGLNVIDTAECYMASEELIGQTISDRRKRYYLFTKCGHPETPGVGDWRKKIAARQHHPQPAATQNRSRRPDSPAHLLRG